MTQVYDERNALVQISDTIGLVAAYAYDGVGNRVSEMDGNGFITNSACDLLNRRIMVTDPLGQTTRLQYDNVNNLITSTDREGRVTCYRYDNLNRKTREVRKASSTDCSTLGAGDIWTATEYDRVGNVTRLITTKHSETPENCVSSTPGLGCEVTRFHYDEVNRLTQEDYPDLKFRKLTYDKVGHQLTRRDPSGRITLYAYNDLYYLVARTYPTTVDTFTYDIAGRMLSADRAGWLVTYEYDAANRVLRTTQNGQAVHYAYDIPNRIRTLAYPGGRIVAEQMDFRDRLDRIGDTFSPVALVHYTYDVGDRVTNREYRNGTYVEILFHELVQGTLPVWI